MATAFLTSSIRTQRPWNNTSFTWQGGDFPINGVLIHFPPTTYGGAWVDSDGDGIPDQADPLPNDATNNSVWWQGGWYSIDGVNQTFPRSGTGRTRATAMAMASRDDIDPLPASATNWHTTYWAGGTFWINNQQQYFSPGDYNGTGTDSDGDGIPDAADPYPGDPSNGNVTAEYTWAGGTVMIDNQTRTLPSGTIRAPGWTAMATASRILLILILSMPATATRTFYWGGGWFSFNNQVNYFPPGDYAGSWADSDGDGVPDVCDMYPYDASNGNASYSWGGGTFRIANNDVYIPGGTYADYWMDSDGDGIPDPQDPYPNDANNGNSTTTTFTWSGGTFRINNADQVFQSCDYTGNWVDSDGDGIPDNVDPYPYDPANGNTTFYWAGGTFRVANANSSSRRAPIRACGLMMTATAFLIHWTPIRAILAMAMSPSTGGRQLPHRQPEPDFRGRLLRRRLGG